MRSTGRRVFILPSAAQNFIKTSIFSFYDRRAGGLRVLLELYKALKDHNSLHAYFLNNR